MRCHEWSGGQPCCGPIKQTMSVAPVHCHVSIACVSTLAWSIFCVDANKNSKPFGFVSFRIACICARFLRYGFLWLLGFFASCVTAALQCASKYGFLAFTCECTGLVCNLQLHVKRGWIGRAQSECLQKNIREPWILNDLKSEWSPWLRPCETVGSVRGVIQDSSFCSIEYHRSLDMAYKHLIAVLYELAQRLFVLGRKIDMPHSDKHMAVILLVKAVRIAFGICCRNIRLWFHNKGKMVKQVFGFLACTSNIEKPQVTGTWCRLFLLHVQLWMSAGRSGKPVVSLEGA